MHLKGMILLIRDEQAVLRSPFNVEVHKETFINYLEVVILEDGSIEYAVPSHQLKVTDIIAAQRNITRKDVFDICPPEYYLDFNFWLCKEAKAIMVWNRFFIGKPNNAQIQTLLMLMEEKLYHGGIDWTAPLNK